MVIPKTLPELKNFLELSLPEDVGLEYKGSGSVAFSEKARKELAKDVSAFANADGGVIIYGVGGEVAGQPHQLDGGIPNERAVLDCVAVQSNERPGRG